MYLYLTTKGWKTGRDREIEIWFTELEGRYYLISEKRDEAHWVQNLRRERRVRFRVGDKQYAAMAHPLDGAEDADLAERVRRLSDAKYGWSAGLVVELRPDRR